MEHKPGADVSKCLLALLLDAFRPDYLRHTRFLKHLAVTGAQGRLVEPFGFSAWSAYFGGLTPGDAGYSHLYWYDPVNSPFRVAKYLPRTAAGRHVDAAMRAELVRYVKTRVPEYVAAYANAASIPLEYVHYFDTPEVCAPYDPTAGFESIFAKLECKGMPWYGMFWPLTNRLPVCSDEQILGDAMGALTPEHRFAFVHLSILDMVGHEYGPSSAEIITALQKLDRQVETLVNHCKSLYDHVDIVIFGDHGMVDVIATLDLDREIRKHGLQYGNDYVAFYDSSMARFWCANRATEQKLVRALQEIGGGRLLSEDDKIAWDIATCDPRNGQLYFLCHPGTVIFPNFFQTEGSMVKGMHGYAPDVRDNQGIFILNDGKSRGAVNDVHATQLFHTFVDLLGLDDESSKPGRSARSQVQTPSPDAPRYTFALARSQEALIDQHLATVCRELNRLDARRDAIVLTGGFGRGEGTVRFEHGHAVPVNDYDLVLVTGTPVERDVLNALGKRLAKEFDIDYVDLGVVETSSLPTLRLNQFVFDLKYGSMVLEGDPTILEHIPSFSAKDIPAKEAARLFFNRLAGVMNALPNYGDVGELDEHARRRLAFQMSKMWIAVGDALLLRWGGYDASYALRRLRFADLSASGGVSAAICDAVCVAYDYKLGTSDRVTGELDSFVSLLVSTVADLLRLVIAPVYRIDTEIASELDVMLRALVDLDKSAGDREITELWAAMTLLIRSHDSKTREADLKQAARWLYVNGEVDYPILRERAWKTWERLCH